MTPERLEVNPTRRELLRLKQRKELAGGIDDILQKDLGILFKALIEHAKEAKMLRGQLHNRLSQAYSKFFEAEMVVGSLKVKELAITTLPTEFKVSPENELGVLGLEFPSLHLKRKEEKAVNPGFNVVDTPVQLQEAASGVEDGLKAIVKLAELTGVIRRLLDEIALKNRQRNRLRFEIIPQLDATIQYVEVILEEIERQDATRVRVLQRKRKERAEK
ncbi:MAG: V-type ATP synthase subunit D [Thermoproteota archaeon]